MRHRARRPLAARLLTALVARLVARLVVVAALLRRASARAVAPSPGSAAFPAPGPASHPTWLRLRAAVGGRRAVAAAASLVVAGATAGVAIAMGQDGPGPVTSAVPPLADASSTAAGSGLTDHPSQRVSRSGERKASGTPGDAGSDAAAPSVAGPSSTGPSGAAPPLAAETGSAAASGGSSPKSSGTGSTGTGTGGASGPSSPTAPSSPASSAPSGTSAPSPEPGPVDDVPPQTTATTVAVDGSSWTVLLGADEPAGFACSLDGGAFAPCAVTATFTGLSRGTHTLAVQATDLAGNTDPTPVQLTAKVHGPA